MPREIGLGDSLGDEDIDGDIDFDFFDEGKGGGDSGSGKDETLSTSSAAQLLKTIGDAGDGLAFKAVEDKNSGITHEILTISADAKRASYLTNENETNGVDTDGSYVSRSECVSVSRCLNVKSCASSNTCSAQDNVSASVADSEVVALASRQLIRSYRSAKSRESDSDDSEEDGDRDGDDEDSDNSLDVTVTESDSSVLSDDSLENLSDSEITDVTPLSSTNNSPLPASPNRLQNRKLYGNSGLPLRKRENVKFLDNVGVVGRSRHSSNSSAYDSPSGANPGVGGNGSSSVDLNLLVEAILEMERDRKRKLMTSPTSNPAQFVDRPMSSRSRKNMSFTNDQVRKIDRENHILLKKILDSKQNVPRSASAIPRVVTKPASSAINRLRQQKKIEAENLLLLKRIQSAKPTKELSRTYLLKSQHDHLRVSHSLPVSRSVSQASILKYSSRRSDVASSSSPSSSRVHSRSHSANSTSTQSQNGHAGRCSTTKHSHKTSKNADSTRPELNSVGQAKI